MSAGTLAVIDHTVQETHLWLKALLAEMGGEDQHRAYLLLRAALHALRDRLGPVAAAQLAAQLPMLLRGLFYEGWRPGDSPTKERHKEAFLEHLRRELPPGMKVNVEEAARAVFEVLWAKIDPGEVVKLQKLLPAELRDLWPAVSRAD